MPATTTRTPRAAAKKKATEPPPPEEPVEPCSLEEAIIKEVMAQFDRSGVVGALAEMVAPRLARAIRLDELADRLLQQRQEQLSAQLVERLLEKLAAPA